MLDQVILLSTRPIRYNIEYKSRDFSISHICFNKRLYLIIDISRDRLQNRKMLIEEPEVLKQWLTTHLEPL